MSVGALRVALPPSGGDGADKYSQQRWPDDVDCVAPFRPAENATLAALAELGAIRGASYCIPRRRLGSGAPCVETPPHLRAPALHHMYPPRRTRFTAAVPRPRREARARVCRALPCVVVVRMLTDQHSRSGRSAQVRGLRAVRPADRAPELGVRAAARARPRGARGGARPRRGRRVPPRVPSELAVCGRQLLHARTHRPHDRRDSGHYRHGEVHGEPRPPSRRRRPRAIARRRHAR